MYTCPHLTQIQHTVQLSCSSLHGGARTRVRWQHRSVSERVDVHVYTCVSRVFSFSYVSPSCSSRSYTFFFLPRGTKERDLDDAFYSFGPMVRIDLKSGFAFVVSLLLFFRSFHDVAIHT
jgi:hypothetical protein